MKWATRPGAHVDRTRCAWLIRRFIDPEAQFPFIADLADVPADMTPFDMRDAELSHHGGGCTFETMLRRYELDDPALWDTSVTIHERDVEDERVDAPEARGVDVILPGFSMVCDDDETLAITARRYDGRYEHRRRATMLDREPS